MGFQSYLLPLTYSYVAARAVCTRSLNTDLGMAAWSSTEVVLFPWLLILCGVFFWSLMDMMGIITGFPAITKKCWVSSLSQGNLWTWSCSSAAFTTFGDLPLLLALSPKLLTWPLSSSDAGPAYFLTSLTPFCLAVSTATTLAFSLLRRGKLLPIWCCSVYLKVHWDPLIL